MEGGVGVKDMVSLAGYNSQKKHHRDHQPKAVLHIYSSQAVLVREVVGIEVA
jgi:hypothetical protein